MAGDVLGLQRPVEHWQEDGHEGEADLRRSRIQCKGSPLTSSIRRTSAGQIAMSAAEGLEKKELTSSRAAGWPREGVIFLLADRSRKQEAVYLKRKQVDMS
eukprot:767876-Hanusia_phi.AAC.8